MYTDGLVATPRKEKTPILIGKNWGRQILLSTFALSKRHIKCFGFQRELVQGEHQNMSNKLRDGAVKRF